MHIRLNEEKTQRAKDLGVNCSMVARIAIEEAIKKMEREEQGGSPQRQPAQTRHDANRTRQRDVSTGH